MALTETINALVYSHHHGKVQDVPSVGEEIKNIIEEKGLENYVFLQTCNRAEAYFSSGVSLASPSGKAVALSGREALEHLLRVAAGVDSLVVGETEILHQLKEAYREAAERGTLDSDLRRVFDHAHKFGKKVRRETDISSGKVSVASIGLERLREVVSDLDGKKAVIIGAGKIGSKVARYLKDTSIQEILVANRTYENAVKLSKEVKGKSYRLSKLPKLIREVEIIICATGAPHYILTPDKIPELEEEKILLDLSVPTNVHPKVKEHEYLKYISYRELSGKARENLVKRRREVKKVKKMLQVEVESFLREDPFEDLYKEAEAIRKEQIKKARKELEKRSEEEVLWDLSRSISEKIISAVKERLHHKKKLDLQN